MLPHLSVHFKTHADDHILPLLLKVWTIPFPNLVTGFWGGELQERKINSPPFPLFKELVFIY